MRTKLLSSLLVVAIFLGSAAVARATPSSNLMGAQFVHVATSANTSGHTTIVDHPLLNGNPNAIFFVTHNWNPGGVGDIYNNHNLGVYYIGGKWRIFNQGGNPIAVGTTFNVLIPEGGSNVFVHTVTAGSLGINHPLTNGNPNALILITQNWNPGGGVGVYNNHAVGVYYDGSAWRVFNQDSTPIPEGASFNVLVLPAGLGFLHTSTSSNTAFNETRLDHPLTNNQPNALVFITANWNPGGVVGFHTNFPTGVYYFDGNGQWSIFNEDALGNMPIGASFNVLVLPPVSEVFVHKANPANTLGNSTDILNPLPKTDPNVLVFATQNWNPGGIGGTYNNRNIGVWFGTKWKIFNQNNDPMPNAAAFNVLLRSPDAATFVHKATADNIIGHITRIDYPLINGNPDAILIVTPNWNPSGFIPGVYNDHPIGLYYDDPYWTIYNQDLAAMPVNAYFNVILPTPGFAEAILVHKATASNVFGNDTLIDHPLTNNNPNAILLVTPVFNPGDSCPCAYFNASYGVYYQNGDQKWAIFNQNTSASMPLNAAFNVYILAKRSLYLPLVTR